MLDFCSRRVVGWSIDSAPTAALVTNALGMAIENRRPPAGTIIHSDTESSSVAEPSPRERRHLASCPLWDRSATATTTPSSRASGRACRSNSWTGVDGVPAWN
ncbi:DDE-type integrase/transposase/recombinase [Cellulosimicrobium sp. I38E]|uniref:DDE-type integrase/transposase/recombinase n=1 Tax=Cellulosimicrobium sp. I38E TaxID=1393139 RepID=UPI0009EE9B29